MWAAILLLKKAREWPILLMWTVKTKNSTLSPHYNWNSSSNFLFWEMVTEVKSGTGEPLRSWSMISLLYVNMSARQFRVISCGTLQVHLFALDFARWTSRVDDPLLLALIFKYTTPLCQWGRKFESWFKYSYDPPQYKYNLNLNNLVCYRHLIASKAISTS